MKKQLIWLMCCLALLLPITAVQAQQDATDCNTGAVWDTSLPVLARGFVQVPAASIYQVPSTTAIITGQLTQGTPVVLWGRTELSDWLQLLPDSPAAPARWIAAPEVSVACGSIAALPAAPGIAQQAAVNPSAQVAVPNAQIPLSPEQAVTAYYEGINIRQYDYTWAQLTTTFKNRYNCPALYKGVGEYACNVPTINDYDYLGYQNWWNSVQLVEVTDMQRVCADASFAVVRVDFTYHLFTGGLISQPDRYIKLQADPVTQSWLYHDVGYLPRNCTASLP